MSKKLLAIVLAVALVLSLCSTVMAAEAPTLTFKTLGEKVELSGLITLEISKDKQTRTVEISTANAKGYAVLLVPANKKIYYISNEKISTAGVYSIPKKIGSDEIKAAYLINSTPTPDPNPVQPTITNVHIYSDNADPTYATNGNIITVLFTSDVPVLKLSNFKIHGSNPDVFELVKSSGTTWNYKATHLVDSGDQDADKATFQINVTSVAQNIYSKTIENNAITDGSFVKVRQSPQISSIRIVSDNANPVYATIGNIITLTFNSNVAVDKLGNFKICGGNPDTFAQTQNGSGYTYTVTHKVDGGDSDGLATFQINVVSKVNGTYSQTIESTTDHTYVSIEKSPVPNPVQPTITNVHIYSDNADPTYATNGNIITVLFTSDVPVLKLSNFKIHGSNPDVFELVKSSGTTWDYKATHLVDSGDQDADKATFQINVTSVAQNIFSKTIENNAITDGSFVKVRQSPQISSIKIVSDNANPVYATIGNIITLTFNSNVAVDKLGNFKICGGNPDTFAQTQNGSGYTYTVTHKVDGGDSDGLATFQINVVSKVNETYSQTIEATTDHTYVSIEKSPKI